LDSIRTVEVFVCPLFLFRHGQDKKIAEVQRGWERAIDKTFDLKDWR
jgi:hypothetical protein